MQEEFGELDGVEGGALAEVVAGDEQGDAATAGHALVLPDPADEGVVAATRRTVRGFVTDELPGVPLRVTVAGATVRTVTDAEGYFHTRWSQDGTEVASGGQPRSEASGSTSLPVGSETTKTDAPDTGPRAE